MSTTSARAALPPAAFLQSGTGTLIGEGRLNSGLRSGARFEADVWIGDHRTIGCEDHFFFLESYTVSQAVAFSGVPGSPAWRSSSSIPMPLPKAPFH